MQPYFFPYSGYFQLVAAVEDFVFYDDAAFSKNGWYNRNRIMASNNQWIYFRLQTRKASLGTSCNEIGLVNKSADFEKIRKQLENSYKKAPYYEQTMALVNRVELGSTADLASVTMQSVIEVACYLELDTNFSRSSQIDYDRSLERHLKVIEICKHMSTTTYINLPGGRELYTEEMFNEYDISLDFTPSDFLVYQPGNYEFIMGLSILDVLMWLPPHEIRSSLLSLGS